jgi:hypothetical protein
MCGLKLASPRVSAPSLTPSPISFHPTTHTHIHTEMKTCPFCGALNGPVKKITNVFRLYHDVKSVTKNKAEMKEQEGREFKYASEKNQILRWVMDSG